jgi:choline dehydrogenase-like flavoprotein
MDFEANAKDGMGVDWPIRYEDVAPWYEHVERFIGVSGQAEGLAQLPDSVFLPPMEMNCVEKHLKRTLTEKLNRAMTIGRTAHLTALLEHSPHRGKCRYRNRCIRGCPYGAYFSSNSSTLPAAEKTGNMTLRPNSIVYELIHDEKKGRASGVRVLDAETNQQLEFRARVIFLCASTFGSTFILLNSRSSRFPNGFGNDSGELGCNLMDHHVYVGATAVVEGFDDEYYVGDRPNGVYVPRFVNIGKDKRDYLRGFGYQGAAERLGWTRLMTDTTLGAELKQKAATPGPWIVRLGGFGEQAERLDGARRTNSPRASLGAQRRVDQRLELPEVHVAVVESISVVELTRPADRFDDLLQLEHDERNRAAGGVAQLCSVTGSILLNLMIVPRGDLDEPSLGVLAGLQCGEGEQVLSK